MWKPILFVTKHPPWTSNTFLKKLQATIAILYLASYLALMSSASHIAICGTVFLLGDETRSVYPTDVVGQESSLVSSQNYKCPLKSSRWDIQLRLDRSCLFTRKSLWSWQDPAGYSFLHENKENTCIDSEEKKNSFNIFFCCMKILTCLLGDALAHFCYLNRWILHICHEMGTVVVMLWSCCYRISYWSFCEFLSRLLCAFLFWSFFEFCYCGSDI